MCDGGGGFNGGDDEAEDDDDDADDKDGGGDGGGDQRMMLRANIYVAMWCCVPDSAVGSCHILISPHKNSRNKGLLLGPFAEAEKAQRGYETCLR